MTTLNRSERTRAICDRAPVIPVLVIDELAHAVPLARALTKGGLDVLEITLRTAAALDAIRDMRDALPDAVVGVGTLRGQADVDAAMKAGAQFGVSPGATDEILDACEAADLPLLPGAATPSEMMTLAARGYTVQKLFPAEAVGGRNLLKSVSSPLPDIVFCPTGGIDAESAPGYLALPNVRCVGGSWVAPKQLVADGRWDDITRLAETAAKLART